MFRKRKASRPGFGNTPWNPIQNENANLRQDGASPQCAMFQIAAEDTYANYVICRGFDTRILRFIDYAAGDVNKPGISVAKPFGKRKTGTYKIGEVYPALLPTQGNSDFIDFRQVVYTPPSPVAVNWRVGQNPGVVTGGLEGGQPASLSETIGILSDHNGKVVNWMLIDTNASPGIPFRNDSGFTVPPYGLMQVYGTALVSGTLYLTIKRPIDTTLMRCPLLINNQTECLDTAYGIAQAGPVFRLLTNGVAYAPGDRLGSLNPTFTATYGSMYAVLGNDNIVANVVRTMFDTSCLYGKTMAGGLTAATPANVLVYDANNVLTAKQYLAETKGTTIPPNTDVIMFSSYGRWFASRIC